MFQITHPLISSTVEFLYSSYRGCHFSYVCLLPATIKSHTHQQYSTHTITLDHTQSRATLVNSNNTSHNPVHQ